jgi:alpha-1,2-mannosyltransferase
LIFSLLGVIGFIIFWRSRRKEKLALFAGAICLTVWITPHAMIYDWSIMLLPAILLWQEFPEYKPLWKALFAMIWLATFLSGPLTVMQLKILPVAIQISIPIFFLVLLSIFQVMRGKAADQFNG